MSQATTVLDNFTEAEIGRVGPLDPKLLVMLQAARYEADEIMIISSGLRETEDGGHGDHDNDGDGEGVDITDNAEKKPVGSRWRFKVVAAAIKVGFNRIGIYDKHVHLDVRTDRDQLVMWTGKSR